MRKILLVDNDITFIWRLKKYLQRRGYAVETAATLSEARKMIRQEAPLLVCSELCLLDGSSLELLAEVHTCNKDTPFIIASCYEKDDYEQEVLQNGVTICMDKMKSALLIDKLVEYAWNCQEKCSRINSLNSFSTYAARSSSCSVRYTTGGYPPGLDV